MRIFFAHGGGEAFARWREEQGQTLQDWATWARSPRSTAPTGTPGRRSCAVPAAARARPFVEQHGAVVGFHAWLQWALELQFTAATGGMTVIQDLPIGVAGGGADAWAWQDVLAEGVSVGAPPDAFNTQGQDWGSPPLIPWRLRDADYEPFIQSIRATIAGAGGLRIDHVMGLFRLWWVPARRRAPPTAPTSATPPRTCSTSSRWRATARRPSSSARTSARSRTASARPWPSTGCCPTGCSGSRTTTRPTWPAAAMAAVTTHDLPTVAGLWTGADVAEQREHGTGTDEELERGRAVAAGPPARAARRRHRPRRRSSRRTGCSPGRRRCCCRRRWTTPSASRAGRTCPAPTDRPNWSLPLPVPVEDLPGHPLVQTVAAHPRRRDRARGLTRPGRRRTPVRSRARLAVRGRRDAPRAGRDARSASARRPPGVRRVPGRPDASGAAATPAARRRRRGPALLGARPAGGRRAPGRGCSSSGGSGTAPGRAGSPTR